MLARGCTPDRVHVHGSSSPLIHRGRTLEMRRQQCGPGARCIKIECPIWCWSTVLLLSMGCATEAPIVEEIRGLKTITVGAETTSQVRRFSGTVRAIDRSALSFEVAGNVLSVRVDIGAEVKHGDILAELDQEPYQLEVQKAEAELVTAKANVKKQQAEYERQQRLFAEGAGSQRRLEQAEFAFRESQANVDFVVSKLNLSRRDLRKTVLYAPYDGSIGVRQVEPFVDVQRGQKLFEIDAKGDQEIVVAIPETVVHLLTVGLPVAVSFPTLPGQTVAGSVTEVGTVAGEGNAFPVKVRLLDPPPRVRSGMTAEASFELQGTGFAGGYLLPAQAMLPSLDTNRGFVFVYQPDSSTVKQVPIQCRGVKDNQIVVTQGISPGDVLAAAGVSFLSDGMRVKRMPPRKEADPEPLDIE